MRVNDASNTCLLVQDPIRAGPSVVESAQSQPIEEKKKQRNKEAHRGQ
jgi:hypothetical protein